MTHDNIMTTLITSVLCLLVRLRTLRSSPHTKPSLVPSTLSGQVSHSDDDGDDDDYDDDDDAVLPLL